jgi:Uma2 family endonuclease
MTIEIDAHTDYEPDAVVNCGPSIHPDAIAAPNPIIVVEVLSPATQSIDSSDKLADYFRLPSIQHCLIVRTRRREIIHHRRNGDDIISRPVHTATIALDPPGISIAIADVYGPA